MKPRSERHRRRDQTARLPGRWRKLGPRRGQKPDQRFFSFALDEHAARSYGSDMTNTRFRTVHVPAYAQFQAEYLIEGRLEDGRTTGLCRTVEEACERLDALEHGVALRTQAPDYQANETEMADAAATLKNLGIRDGGKCEAAVSAAIKAGIHTVEWAIASRYLVAGWV